MSAMKASLSQQSSPATSSSSSVASQGAREVSSSVPLQKFHELSVATCGDLLHCFVVVVHPNVSETEF